jgi:hypothetical protein
MPGMNEFELPICFVDGIKKMIELPSRQTKNAVHSILLERFHNCFGTVHGRHILVGMGVNAPINF